jgi:hypothetical protein
MIPLTENESGSYYRRIKTFLKRMTQQIVWLFYNTVLISKILKFLAKLPHKETEMKNY